MTEEIQKKSGFSRRTVVKGAAWSVPVIAAAVATPLAAASAATDVGAFSVDGACGLLGVVNSGFDVTAGPAPLPAGTVITITTTGVANIGLFTVTGGLADVQLIGTDGNQVTLTAPLAAGTTLELRSVIGLGVISTMTATATLPSGYTATGAKTTGTINQTLVLCTDS